MEPLGVQRHTVPHFKGLINAKVDLEAQGRDTTFTLCHAQLRKPILLLEMAKGMNIKWPECRCLPLSEPKTGRARARPAHKVTPPLEHTDMLVEIVMLDAYKPNDS